MPRASRRSETYSAPPADSLFDKAPISPVDAEMIVELHAVLEQLEHDPEPTLVVFESADDDHIVARQDIPGRPPRQALRRRRGSRGRWTSRFA